MMCAHVERYYWVLAYVCQRDRRPFAQLCYETAAMIEHDPQWRPEHLC